MPAVISTITRRDCLRGVSARQCQRTLPTVDTANRPWPTSVAPRGGSPSVGQRVTRSFPERWPAVPAARGKARFSAAQGHQLALEGQPDRCPFLIGSRNGRQVARPRFAHRLRLRRVLLSPPTLHG